MTPIERAATVRERVLPAFLLTEAVLALALLAIVALLIAHFEYRASATSKHLERKYIATAAAESQFERLRAGLDVLTPDAFRLRYPGLELSYRVEPPKPNAPPVGVVTVTSRDEDTPVFFRLTAPLPSVTAESGAKRP